MTVEDTVKDVFAKNLSNAVDDVEVVSDVVTERDVRNAAMSLLARREHSRFELQQKLSRRFPTCRFIDQVIQQLADEALQSDDRFTEAFIAMRARKGQGPIRISNELEQRRVDKNVVEQCLQPYRGQWTALAKKAFDKKYPHSTTNLSDKAKQIRFLQYRGFTGEQIQGIWSAVEEKKN